MKIRRGEGERGIEEARNEEKRRGERLTESASGTSPSLRLDP